METQPVGSLQVPQSKNTRGKLEPLNYGYVSANGCLFCGSAMNEQLVHGVTLSLSSDAWDKKTELRKKQVLKIVVRLVWFHLRGFSPASSASSRSPEKRP